MTTEQKLKAFSEALEKWVVKRNTIVDYSPYTFKRLPQAPEPDEYALTTDVERWAADRLKAKICKPLTNPSSIDTSSP